jgi:hypothetical protein
MAAEFPDTHVENRGGCYPAGKILADGVPVRHRDVHVAIVGGDGARRSNATHAGM